MFVNKEAEDVAKQRGQILMFKFKQRGRTYNNSVNIRFIMTALLVGYLLPYYTGCPCPIKLRDQTSPADI